ncbi:MAG TPA: response regulator [Rudaea sp.]|jgi:FixJ family two-component response regulator
MTRNLNSATDGDARISACETDEPVVIVVDDDELVRSALRRLFVSSKVAAEFYASGTHLLAEARFDRLTCIILDVRMPGMDGLEVQARLKQRHVDVPLIFLTASSDIPIAVSAMREGAIDFIEKPFDSDDLLARVRHAIDRHRHVRREAIEQRVVSRKLTSLTPREYDVLEALVTGKTNKQIARIPRETSRLRVMAAWRTRFL